jgi:hypothetical protein
MTKTSQTKVHGLKGASALSTSEWYEPDILFRVTVCNGVKTYIAKKRHPCLKKQSSAAHKKKADTLFSHHERKITAESFKPQQARRYPSGPETNRPRNTEKAWNSEGDGSITCRDKIQSDDDVKRTEVIASLLREKPRTVHNAVLADALGNVNEDVHYLIQNLIHPKKRRNCVVFNHCVEVISPVLVNVYIKYFKIDKNDYPELAKGYVSSQTKYIFWHKMKGERAPFLEFLGATCPNELSECKLTDKGLTTYKWNRFCYNFVKERLPKTNTDMRSKTEQEYHRLNKQLLDKEHHCLTAQANRNKQNEEINNN